jgi:hypothetical protein
MNIFFFRAKEQSGFPKPVFIKRWKKIVYLKTLILKVTLAQTSDMATVNFSAAISKDLNKFIFLPDLKKLFILVDILFMGNYLIAQTKSTQLWTDFTLNKDLEKNLSFDCELSYRTILNSSDKWHSFNVIPKIEKSLGRHWDLLLYIGSINTLQQQAYNTWEARPGLGVRFRFTPIRKLQLRILARLELRNQYTFETHTWSQELRSRFRLEEIYFINGDSFAKNHLWYILSDFEIFLTIDKEFEERYSNRTLLRLGLGYKFNDKWRFETIYTYQYSKNTIDGEFSKEDENIIRLRFRYYMK